MVRVLLTGFEPFGGAASNPSWIAAETVAREWDGADAVVAALLPVEFERGVAELEDAIARHSPDIVIALGLAEGRTAITPERRGLNLDEARIPDNAGAQPRGAIDPEGPAERPSTLPVDAIVDALRARGIPAEPSLSAGGYVCNRVLYRLLGRTAGTGIRAGFVHVPATPETGLGERIPTMEQGQITAAVTIVVRTVLATR